MTLPIWSPKATENFCNTSQQGIPGPHIGMDRVTQKKLCGGGCVWKGWYSQLCLFGLPRYRFTSENTIPAFTLENQPTFMVFVWKEGDLLPTQL